MTLKIRSYAETTGSCGICVYKTLRNAGIYGRARRSEPLQHGALSEFEQLAAKLVVEVQYHHFSGGRFRDGTKLLRGSPNKAPAQCSMSQVELESRSPLGLLAA